MIRRSIRSHATFIASERESALMGAVPHFMDGGINGGELQALEARLSRILQLSGEVDEAMRDDVEAAIQAIRDLWDHTELVYDAVEESAAEVDESILEAGQGMATAKAHAEKADAVVAGVYGFFDYIDGAGRDPMLLTIARVERENLLRTGEAWKNHED